MITLEIYSVCLQNESILEKRCLYVMSINYKTGILFDYFNKCFKDNINKNVNSVPIFQSDI